MLVRHPTDPHAITDYAVDNGEWILEDYQFPCPRYLAVAPDVWEALELFGFSTSLRDDSVSSELTVFDVEVFDSEQSRARRAARADHFSRLLRGTPCPLSGDSSEYFVAGLTHFALA